MIFLMMIRTVLVCSVLIGCGSVPARGQGGEPAPAFSLGMTIRAGAHDRCATPIQFPIAADRLGPGVIAALADGPVGLRVTHPDGSRPSVVQVDRLGDGSIAATWVLTEPIAAGGAGRFQVDGSRVVADAPLPWAVAEPTPGAVEFRNLGRLVFRYNAASIMPPASLGKPNPHLVRDAYIHPAFSPGGALVTGDFSVHHPHHRGIFLAYVHTRWGTAESDFWNIQSGTGRIVADGSDRPRVGPVAVRFEARHRWEALVKGPSGGIASQVALRERWQIDLYDVPGSAYWLFDLTSTQQAEGHPLEVLPFRYGGMAYRSAEPSVRGPLDVLTAEGRHRFDGDQQPTRWVDLTGPIAEGSPNYAGAMIADHPENPNHPTVVRIHPITLPFFSFVPAHDRPLTIPTDRALTFRYRVIIHDGRPDPALNDRVAADFGEPPSIRID